MNKINFVFLGTSDFSVIILEKLKEKGFLPSLIITVPDKPKGRKMVLTPPEVKVWAEKNNIKYIQPSSLRRPEVLEEIKSFSKDGFDLFIVASYGKIIPQDVLDIPRKQTLNVHPSLLPKLRGASPVQSAILSEDETGVTIMRIDAEMDHGPILEQAKVEVEDWPPYTEDLKKILGEKGGEMLADILPKWMNGEIREIEQNHDLATFCGKIEKENGEINMEDSPILNLRKIRAYHKWPGAYYFQDTKDKKIRVIIKRAKIEDGKLILERVVPEGKKEMSYDDFMRGLK